MRGRQDMRQWISQKMSSSTGSAALFLTWDASPFQFHKFGGGVSRTKRLILPIVYCLHDKKSAADQIGESIGESVKPRNWDEVFTNQRWVECVISKIMHGHALDDVARRKSLAFSILGCSVGTGDQCYLKRGQR